MKAPEDDPDAKTTASKPDRARVDDPRIYLAAERTFLSWIRTSVALMAFGFVIARFGLFLREYRATLAPEITPAGTQTGWMGVGVVGLGVGVTVFALIRHRLYIRALDRGETNPLLSVMPALALAAILAVVGLAIAGHILFSF